MAEAKVPGRSGPWWGLLPWLGLVAGCGAGAGDSLEPSAPRLQESRGVSFGQFEASTWRDPDGAYVVDGDTVLADAGELADFYDQDVERGALIVDLQPGGADRWTDAQKLSLTYCVSPRFGYRYAAVVGAMEAATGAWEQAASVRFIHVSSEDGHCSADDHHVVFDVSPAIPEAPYYARSFLPHHTRPFRNVLIHESAFAGPFSLAGILRHELGHVLGFRHEHTRPQAGRCFEDKHWRVLTAYDPDSVMFYPWCGGMNRGLVLSPLDVQGVQRLYGTPGAPDVGEGGPPGDDSFFTGDANGVKDDLLSRRRGWDADH